MVPINDGGVIILIILGLITSLFFISRYIIDPLVNKKSYSKMKIILSIIPALFFLVLLVLDLGGFFEYH